MMKIGDRIRSLLSDKGWSEGELARRARMKQPTVHRIIAGDSKDPRQSNVEAIAYALGVEPHWLRTGRSPIRREPAATLLELTQVVEDSEPPAVDEVDVPFYREVELAAGVGRFEVIENHGHAHRFRLSMLERAGVAPKDAACALVRGDSMEPLIPNGSPIGIDRSATSIKDGQIYAIDHDGMLRVKYLYRLPLNRIRIASENSGEYPDEVLSPEDLQHLRIIGQVFWWEVVRSR